MKRDMELVRQIMFKLEEVDGTEPFPSTIIEVDGFDRATIAYHCALLHNCGYISGNPEESIGGGAYFDMYIQRLTSSGHDFIDAARNDTIWNKLKSKVLEQSGNWTLGVIFKYLEHSARQQLGF